MPCKDFALIPWSRDTNRARRVQIYELFYIRIKTFTIYNCQIQTRDFIIYEHKTNEYFKQRSRSNILLSSKWTLRLAHVIINTRRVNNVETIVELFWQAHDILDFYEPECHARWSNLELMSGQRLNIKVRLGKDSTQIFYQPIRNKTIKSYYDSIKIFSSIESKDLLLIT